MTTNQPATIVTVTYQTRKEGTNGNFRPREFSVPCFEETTEAIYKTWHALYGHRWEAAGLVSAFIGRDRRQLFPFPK